MSKLVTVDKIVARHWIVTNYHLGTEPRHICDKQSESKNELFEVLLGCGTYCLYRECLSRHALCRGCCDVATAY